MSKRKLSYLSGLAAGALAAGALLLGSPGGAAAAEPATAAQARSMAQESLTRAEQYRLMGGTGYKTGLVQREEADAARYTALADQMESPATPTTDPAAEHFAAQAEHDRLMGGAAYKTGMVQSAEAEEREAEAAAQPPTKAETPNPNCLASKPVVILNCE